MQCFSIDFRTIQEQLELLRQMVTETFYDDKVQQVRFGMVPFWSLNIIITNNVSKPKNKV